MITDPAVIPYHRKVQLESHIVIMDCASCGIPFGLGNNFVERRRDDHGIFYCPNGHGQNFLGQTEIEKERDQLKRRLESARTRGDSWKDQAEAAERSRRAQKGANTRLRKRVAAGVCPCCKRTFQNVAAHMATQHPEEVV